MKRYKLYFSIFLVCALCACFYKLYRFGNGDADIRWVRRNIWLGCIGRDGILYTRTQGDEAQIDALDAANGRAKWTYSPSVHPTVGPILGPHNAVFFGSDPSVMPGDFVALNASTGKFLWKAKGNTTFIVVSPENIVYFGTNLLTALDGATGKKLWTFHRGFALDRPDL